jgi:hypothetical protein
MILLIIKKYGKDTILQYSEILFSIISKLRNFIFLLIYGNLAMNELAIDIFDYSIKRIKK